MEILFLGGLFPKETEDEIINRKEVLGLTRRQKQLRKFLST